MSRSAFAARFTDLVGEPAMQYVTRWRMHLALDELTGGDATVAELADRLGYRSEAAFARAFKRVIGSPPGAVRAPGRRARRDAGVRRMTIRTPRSVAATSCTTARSSRLGRLPPAGRSVIIAHTEVLEGGEGQGWGSQLVRAVLEDLRGAA